MTARLSAILFFIMLASMSLTAEAQESVVYRARLSAQDHFNSKGKKLQDAVAILRQDRANYHRYNLRDGDDQYDPLFASKENRARMEAMLGAKGLDFYLRDIILKGNPLVEVRIENGVISVKLVPEGLAKAQPQKPKKQSSGLVPLSADNNAPLHVFVTRLGPADHFNSKGKKLSSAEGIIRQDRANYHKFNIRDEEDQYDPFFTTKERREELERRIQYIGMSDRTRKAILETTPVVLIKIWSIGVEVTLYEP